MEKQSQPARKRTTSSAPATARTAAGGRSSASAGSASARGSVASATARKPVAQRSGQPRVSAARSQAIARRPGPARRHAVREPRFITVRKRRQERAPFPLGIVLVLGVITVLFLFMMMNYAEIDKYNGEITSLKREVASLQAEQKKLDVRLENKNDRLLFEQYATEQLGMVKSDSLDKHIVNLGSTDKTEILSYEDGKESGFGYLLSGLAEVFRDFLP